MNQAQIICNIQRAVKELGIANAKMDDKSEKWVAHLAKVIQLECQKLIPKGK